MMMIAVGPIKKYKILMKCGLITFTNIVHQSSCSYTVFNRITIQIYIRISTRMTVDVREAVV